MAASGVTTPGSQQIGNMLAQTTPQMTGVGQNGRCPLDRVVISAAMAEPFDSLDHLVVCDRDLMTITVPGPRAAVADYELTVLLANFTSVFVELHRNWTHPKGCPLGVNFMNSPVGCLSVG